MADTTAAPTPAPAPAKVPKNGEWTSSMLDIADDPITAVVGYCLPYVYT